MKKIYSLLVAAAMVLGATSCQQEAIDEVAANEPVTFSATLGATRTELGENDKVMWNADDKIAVYTQESLAGTVFSTNVTEAASTATFTTTSEFAASETGYLAVYPELKYDLSSWPATGAVPAATYADGVYNVPVNIGIEQDVVANGWDEKYNYMVAFSNTNKLAFQAVTALIEFTYNGPMGGQVFITAEGANLAGEGTLSYNTADGSISVATNGTSTSITLFGVETGNTYLVPIFPGKVTNFKVSGYNQMWSMEDYIAKDEIEFKAGKIYAKASTGEEPATPSPWMLYAMNDFGGQTSYSMTIDENNYHVAKNVAWSEMMFFYKYDFNVGEQILAGSKAVVAGEWQATAEDTTGAGFCAPDGQTFDIYLSEDASMMCVVAAGEAVPAMPEPFVPEQTTWAVCGDLNSWGDTFMYTTPTENLFVAKDISLTAYSPFKIRKNSAWTINYGGNYKYGEPNKYMSVWKDGQDMAVTQTGTYDIYFQYISSNEGKIYVVTAGEDYTTAVAQTAEGPMPNPTGVVFGLVGAHNSWGSNDIKMALDETLNAYVAKSAKLTGEFKIRGDESWSKFNYGAASSGTVTVGKGISVSNGSNTNLKVKSGTYDVYFSYAKNMVWVMNVGEVPADL